MVTTCYELRKKRLSDFEIEDLRLMIGQNLSLDYLVPLTLEIMDDNIYSEGELYCGDLLKALLRIDIEFWIKNDIYKRDFENIIERNVNDLRRKLYSFRDKFK